MKVLERLQDCAGLPFPIVTIGNFDGLHLGHQAVLKLVKERAEASRGTVIVLTFDPHPLRILAPETELRFLSDSEEKLALLAKAGVDVVMRLRFSVEFAAQTPEEFTRTVLVEGLGVRELYVGQNFRFGKGRQGTIQTLLDAAPRFGFTVRAITPVVVNGIPVSSTRIRDLIQAGNVAGAAVLLGRPYVLQGTVIKGEGRGGELGFPTANLAPPSDRVLPPDGVYAGHLELGCQSLAAVTYIGARPTFGSGARVIETHLLDQGPTLYGRVVRLSFHERLRGDMVFSSPQDLTRQIAVDVQKTREILRNLSAGPSPMTATKP